MSVYHNKKGFTLTELIAVIVILSILISLSTVTFINIRSKILEKDYDNLVTYLEAKAAEYAQETNITTISVEDLIKEGYVTPDDENNIYDPQTKKSMNCYIIKSTFADGKYTAQLAHDLGTEDGKCKTYTKTLNLQICKMDGNVCKTFDSSQWFADNITLGVLYNNEAIKEDARYNWISSNGLSGSEATLTTKTTSISEDTIKCSVEFDDAQSEAKKVIKIDKEAPFVTTVDIYKQYEWVPRSKSVTIKISDGNGSGIDSIYLTDKDITSCANVNFTDKITSTVLKKDLGAGEYSVCVKDKVGNISNNVYKFKVEMIDVEPEAPVFTASDGLDSGKYHSSSYTLTWKSVSKGSQDLIYYYGTNKNNLSSTGSYKYVNKSEFDVVYYVKACSKTGLCSGISSYIANVDEVNPTITIRSSSSGTCSKSHLISALLVDYESGIVGYAVTNSASKPSSWNMVTNINSYNLRYSVSREDTYYIHTIDKVGNTSYKRYGYVCVDNEPPTYHVSTSFDCDDGLNFDVYCRDKNGCDFTWQLSNRYSSYYPNSSRYTYASAIDGKNYLSINICDGVGNCDTYGERVGYCDFSYTPDPDPDPGPGSGSGSGSGSKPPSGPTKFDAYMVCSNKSSCPSSYGGGGRCDPVGSHETTSPCYGKKYVCNCCKSPTVYGPGVSCYKY